MEFKFKDRKYISHPEWGTVHPNHNYWFDPSCIDCSSSRIILSVIDNSQVAYHYAEGGKTNYYKKEFGAGRLQSKDSYLYGIFEWRYSLPIGRNLWPAIWLTGVNDWPPEIDVMEGWSSRKGHYKNKTDYSRFLHLFNDIQPRLHHRLNGVLSSTAKKLFNTNYTWRLYQKMNKTNTCKLIWTPDIIQVFYNNHLVFECKDPYLLSYYNKPMWVVMNNAVTDDFTKEDLKTIKKHFIIYDFKYTQIDIWV